MQIAPFRALRYDAGRTGGFDPVVTLPYDKITPELKKAYLAASPYNLVRVIRNPDHADAARNLAAWREQGVVVQDPRPALYPYDVEYGAPEDRRTRRGLVARVKLGPPGAGQVLPHEHTFGHIKAERLGLLAATRTHIGQVFLVYSADPGSVDGALAAARDAEPLVEARNPGWPQPEWTEVHRVGRLEDPGAIESVQQALAGVQAVIADGHHRYGTAFEFSRTDPAEGAGWVMVTLVNARSGDMDILPSHRLLKVGTGVSPEVLLERAARHFDVLEPGMAAAAERTVFRLLLPQPWGERALVLRGRDALTPQEAPGKPEAWRRLDLAVLHGLLLDPLTSGLEEPFDYARTEAQAEEAVRNGSASAAFVVPAVSFQEILNVVRAGEVMPHKSTDFYPKMLSGLVMYDLDRP